VPGADSGTYLAWAATKPDAEHDHIPAALAPAHPEAAAMPAGAEAAEELAAERDRLARDFDLLRRSRSWRLTAPARFAAGRLRAARARRRRPPAGA